MMLKPEMLWQKRKEKGLSQQQVADAVGISQRAYSMYEDGSRNPKIDKINKLDKVLGLELFDTKVPSNMSASTHHTYAQERFTRKNEIVEFRVPLVTVKARAGYVLSYESIDLVDSLEKYAIPPGISYIGAIWRYFEVDGDSMEPGLVAGDYILCSQVHQDDWANQIRNYQVHVIVTDYSILVKSIFVKENGDWVLISENEQAAPQQIFDKTTLKELWVFRRLIRKDIPTKKQLKITV